MHEYKYTTHGWMQGK